LKEGKGVGIRKGERRGCFSKEKRTIREQRGNDTRSGIKSFGRREAKGDSGKGRREKWPILKGACKGGLFREKKRWGGKVARGLWGAGERSGKGAAV